MGGRGSKSGFSGGGDGILAPMDQQDQQQPPQVDANGFSDTDDSPYHDLFNGRGYYNQQNLGIDERLALQDYLDPDTLAGSLYNFSQNMNYHIANGGANAQEQYVYDTLKDAMHNLGYNVNLTRYDHIDAVDNILSQMGYNASARNLSVSQLKNMLQDGSFSDQRILSTSYNNFKNASAADKATFVTREVKFSYKAAASTQALMPGKGPGGDFGEMLLGPTGNGHNNYKVVDVKLSGAKARVKGGSTSYLTQNQIEIVIEVS